MKRLIWILMSTILIFSGGCTDDSPLSPLPNGVNGTGREVYTWTFQPSGFESDFADVYFVNDKRGWVVGSDNVLLSTSIGGTTWPQAPSMIPEVNFRGVHMVSEQKGWIAGDMNGSNEDGGIYISTNGGAYPETQKLMAFPMNTIFGLGEDRAWSGGERGQMIYTTDGGKSWIESTIEHEFDIYDVHFVNELDGIACGSSGTVINSVDGGNTWTEFIINPMIDIFSIHLVNSSSGWACGSGNSIIRIDKDGGGLEWSVISIANEIAQITWRDIFFLNEKTGWVVGEGGAVYRTNDGGDTWVKESTGTFADLNAIYMISDLKGWIAGDDGVILTYTP